MRTQKFWVYSLKYLVAFGVGAFLLSTFSLIQKKMVGLPFSLAPKAFIIPVLFGGISGLVISIFYIRLRASRERMRDFINNIDDIIQIVGSEGNFLFVNKAWHETLGYSALELKHLKVFDIIHPAHLEQCMVFFQRLFDGEKEEKKFETIFLSKDGEPVYLDGKVNCRFEKGQAVSTRSIFRNVTEQREAEEFKKLAVSIFEKTSEGVVTTDKNMRVSFVNAAFTKITGYAEEALGKNIHQLLPPAEDTQIKPTVMAKSLAQKGSWQGELWSQKKNGEKYPLQLSISTIANSNNEITNYAGIFSDITKRKENEARLYHLATHDNLTDLPNREMFYEYATIFLEEAKEQNSLFAILFLDLDNFKEINDQYGHHAGDTLLEHLSQRLRHRTRHRDIVARFGGDEFAILISNISNEREAKSAARNILNTITKAFNLDGNTVYISASIGISIYTENSEIDSLLKDADKAMYQAKEDGKNRFRFIGEVN